MINTFDEKILDEAQQWIEQKKTVILATVIQTWGSSPRPIGSLMIVNDSGDFSGSVSGGCVEGEVVRQCLDLIKDKDKFKKIDKNFNPIKTVQSIGYKYDYKYDN